MIFLFVSEEADRRRDPPSRHPARPPSAFAASAGDLASTFADLMLITDIGVNLRRPASHGETSRSPPAAAGVPSIITDMATFFDLQLMQSEGLTGRPMARTG